MELKEIIDNVETELNKVVNNSPVKKVMFGEMDANRFNTPAILFELVDTPAAPRQQVVQPNQIMRDLNYNVTVIHSGTNGQQTVYDARNLVLTVYQWLQRQAKNDRRLDGECFDIGCPNIKFGVVAIETTTEPVFMYGGVIELVIRVVETEVTE